MLYKLRDRYSRQRFNRQTRAIFDTPPAGGDGTAQASVLTQLQHKDVQMFLLALKSFASHVPIKNVFILSDGTLTNTDRQLLASHIRELSFLEIADITNPGCPTGGCWERLLAIAAYNTEHYLIQLDADTITLGPLPEIIELIDNNRSFVIGTWDGQDIEPMRTSSERIRTNVKPGPDAHIQMLAEAAFGDLEQSEHLHYVRGCAGFSGFAQSSIDTSFITFFSQQMEQLLGERWRDWGSEQVMSNVVVANTEGAAVLPHPKYCDCTKINDDLTRFIHFVGSCRFTQNCYVKAAQTAVEALSRSQPANTDV